jgi:hypothetical protein
MPPNVSPPEECELEEVRMARQATKESLDEHTRNIFKFFSEASGLLVAFTPIGHTYNNFMQERARSSIAIKMAKSHEVSADGTITYMYWMCARNLGSKYEAPFQKVKARYSTRFWIIDNTSMFGTVHCCLPVGLLFA